MQRYILAITVLSGILLSACSKQADAPAETKAEKSSVQENTAAKETQTDIKGIIGKAEKHADKIVSAADYIKNNRDKVLSLFASAPAGNPDAATVSDMPVKWDDVKGLVAGGLGDTLLSAVKSTVEQLGSEGGFLNNPKVRIPLPDQMDKAANALKAIGQNDLVQSFETSINRAAEHAVKASPEIFINAVSNMTMEDIHAIWKGNGSPLTDFFNRNSRGDLQNAMLPVIKQSTESAGATRIFKQIGETVNEQKNSLVGGLGKLGGSLGSKLGMDNIGDINLDLDSYVLDKSMDGLFKILAEEEAKIRANPKQYGSDLIQSLFKL